MIERLWWLPLFSIISSCLSKVNVVWVKSKFSDNCNLTFNVCIKTVNKFCVSNGAQDWVFIYEINGSEIDSCYSFLNFRYRACFEQGTHWYSDNCRVYTHSKTWMLHDKKNTQLKNYLPFYCVLLIYIKVKASQILHGGTTPVAPNKNWIKAISIHLIRKTSPVFHIYLVVRKSWDSTTMRFPHSSWMNKSIGESSKFPMSSISMQSSSYPTITFFSEELLFFNETVIFLKIILEK